MDFYSRNLSNLAVESHFKKRLPGKDEYHNNKNGDNKSGQYILRRDSNDVAKQELEEIGSVSFEKSDNKNAERRGSREKNSDDGIKRLQWRVIFKISHAKS